MVDANDPRLPWLTDKVSALIKVPKIGEKFIKMATSEDSGAPLASFLNDEDNHRLFIIDGAKDMACFKNPPVNTKKKLTYFMKMGDMKLEAKNMSSLMMGDLSPKLLENMHSVLEGVYLPIMSNAKNQQGWPEVMSREVLELFHKTVSGVYVALGQSMGMTLLPQPPAEMLVADRASKDKDRVHVLETAVVTWTTQIKSVLKTEPESVLVQGALEGHYPGPLEGVEFWTSKATNLERIMKQLEGENIRKVMRVLELTKSPYYLAFSGLVKEVSVAHAEATDNVKFLKPLHEYFSQLHNLDDFKSLPDLFKPIMHLLLMVWKNSKWYNTPPALAVLMCEICNDLIEQARNYIDGPELFNMEPKEAVEKLVYTLRVCSEFKSVYFEYNTKASIECPSNPWKFQNSALFPRLDAFLERCYDLLDLTKTVTQFQMLERVEIGGNKGHALTTYVETTYKDFNQELARWQACGYDVLDVSITKFSEDFSIFRSRVKELEQRLGGILNMGFDDCSTVFSAFKLIDSFGELLERDFIQSDLETKHLALIRQYGEDLKEVQELFTSDRHKSCVGKFFERDGPPLYVNMPPSAGALA